VQACQFHRKKTCGALLAKGKTKPAVELAREIHKRCGWPESEGLLVDAYAARIRSLLKTGLKEEAKALFELVRERYSSAAARLADVGVLVSASSGNLEKLLRPTERPRSSTRNTKGHRKTSSRLRSAISRSFAECRSLTTDHPLRTAAAALLGAFAAVTGGPVEESALVLPEVSHRGPLASWKILVRAIAYFYQQDDAACERCLGIIDPHSAPARLIPALRTMLRTSTDKRLAPACGVPCGPGVRKQSVLQKGAPDAGRRV